MHRVVDMLEVALGLMAGCSVEEKVPASYVVSEVLELLRSWERKKVIFHIDSKLGIRALGWAIQLFRNEETVIKCRPTDYLLLMELE